MSTRPSRFQSGITLTEALVVMAVVLVLTGSMLPNLASRLAQHEVAGVANDLLVAARLARSEALTRRARVAVAPLAGRDWGSGWQVFVDADNDGAFDTGELVLSRFAAPPSSVRVTAHFGVTFAGQYLSFDEAGYPQRAGTEGLLLGRLAISGGGHERVLCVSAATVRLKPATSCG